MAPGPAPTADSAADLLPDGVFCLDRLGLVVYANPRAAQLLDRPRAELVGRDLWEAVPWLGRPDFEDHLRAALLAPDPVHFHLVRPSAQDTGSQPSPETGTSPSAAQENGPQPSGQTGTPPSSAHDTGSKPSGQTGVPPSPAAQDAEPRPSIGIAEPVSSAQDAESAPQPYVGDWLAVSVYPGPDRLTCTIR